MSDRYLKQVIVMRKDLSMPTGKVAAMAAHATMSFIVDKLSWGWNEDGKFTTPISFSPEEWQWLTELDPGIEHTGQVSFAKILVAVQSEQELRDIWDAAKSSELAAFPTYDSGYSHNPVGTFVCLALGPAWPESFAGITDHLKVYR